MTDIKISTLLKFLEALEDYPKCTNRVNLRANLTFGTGLRVRNMLLVNEFITKTIIDRRSQILHITPKGLSLMKMLREIVEA